MRLFLAVYGWANSDHAQKLMSLRARKKEEKLLRIEAAGRALFVEKGFDATTTRAIASRAGVGVGTFFVYFPHKMDLLVHLFLKDTRVVIEAAFESLDGELELVDALLHVFGKLYDYYEVDPRLSRVFLKEILFMWTGASDKIEPQTISQHDVAFNHLLMRLAAIVQRGKERGELGHGVETLDATYHFFGVYSWALMGRLSGALVDRETQMRLLDQALRLLASGMN
jgi:TetR/AcrR family transcriptional regulator, cholesterol catabolism regulator